MVPSFAEYILPMPQHNPSGLRPARVPKQIIAAAALVILTGAAVFYILNRQEKKSVALKDLPAGRVLSVEEIKGYSPVFTQAEQDILRTGPNRKDTASVKLYLLAKAKLEADPLARIRLEQEAVAITDGYGLTPAITADNAQVRSALEALKDGKHPERLNPLVAPKSFDATAYKADPKAYLDVAEPGRVFQSKPAAPGVARIEPVSPYWQQVKQGDSIELAVKAAPGYPVTFTSFDCGSFGNGLTTQTVEADSAGIARVKFLGVPGTVLEANILASSPMTSGQASFQTNTLVYADGKQIAVQ